MRVAGLASTVIALAFASAASACADRIVAGQVDAASDGAAPDGGTWRIWDQKTGQAVPDVALRPEMRVVGYYLPGWYQGFF